MSERNDGCDAAKVYAVVEMEQECNSEKRLTDTVLFASREDALAYLHERYDAARLDADSGSGEFSADYSEDGWYAVVDKDGDLKEGYLSEGMEVRGAPVGDTALKNGADFGQLGDCAKMREAMVIAKKAICNHARANHICASLAWENSTINANCGDMLCAHRDLCEAKTAIQKALAAPPRNCDVGTAEEQYARFNKYCNARHKNDKPNPCGCADRASNPCAKCYSMWAQMPYEEGGTR